jgi:hypothetical protein
MMHDHKNIKLFTPSFALAQSTTQLFCVWPGVLDLKSAKARASAQEEGTLTEWLSLFQLTLARKI